MFTALLVVGMKLMMPMPVAKMTNAERDSDEGDDAYNDYADNGDDEYMMMLMTLTQWGGDGGVGAGSGTHGIHSSLCAVAVSADG